MQSADMRPILPEGKKTPAEAAERTRERKPTARFLPRRPK